MGRLIDCQMALTTWGVKAKFRQGKLGLLRKNNIVYLALFFTRTEYYKLALDPKSIDMLPAAIRFKDVAKDLFVKGVWDVERYDEMLRAIKVLLRRDELRRTGKGDKLDRLIARIPQLNSIRLEDRTPVRVAARVVGHNAAAAAANQQDDIIMGYGNDLVEQRQPCGERNGYKSSSNNISSSVNYMEHSSMDLEQIKRLQNPHLKCIKQIGVHDISENLWSAQRLSSLQLSNCNLTAVPKQLENLSRSLEHLDLSRNSINKLPRTFCCKMNKLKSLNLSQNLLELLPLEIKFFSRLVVLNLAQNRLRLLPTTFSDLRRLRDLNVSQNNLSQLPAFKQDDIQLHTLDISMNPLDGALRGQLSTFEVFPSYDDQLGYEETSYCPSAAPADATKDRVPKLFEITLLRVVRDDKLFRAAAEESLPASIVSTIQRDIFKCYRCNRMNLLPAYNSTDYLEYVHQVTNLIRDSSYCHGMTFMKLLCRGCFGNTGT